MKRRKDGSFNLTLDLAPGQDYQYRFLLDDDTWVSDDQADRLQHCSFGDCQNSVVSV